MAGTIVGIANSQQHDVNGGPLSNCLCTVFAGGTTTPTNVFQDIGLLIPAQNPLVGDSSGRIPLFFVADGTYHVRLTDQFGNMNNGGFDIPQIPSIGASASGGGGTVVDPTTVASTGDVKWRLENNIIIPGWVRINGRTIGNAASGATERANADTQALWIYAYTTYSDTLCPVVGGRGAGALVDYNANKQLTLLDSRGRSIFGLDDMGSTNINNLAAAPFTKGTAIIGGASGGENAHTLTLAETAAHTHPNSLVDPSHFHPAQVGIGTNAAGNVALGPNGGAGTMIGIQTDGGAHTTNAGFTGMTITNGSAGNGASHNNIPLLLLGTLFWKL